MCPKCAKPEDLCICSEIRPLTSQRQIILLQHPQEPDKELGTARMVELTLSSAKLKVGLSWPNLKKVVEKESPPSRWGVLYLGSGLKGKPTTKKGLQLVSKTGEALPDSDNLFNQLEGMIVLDGTWSQAKTLWWRNAWLLKLRRAILIPERPSLYRELRREPRRECMSSLESVALTLDAWGEPAESGQELRRLFSVLLDKQRARRRGANPIPKA